jgi:hypothetical protein
MDEPWTTPLRSPSRLCLSGRASRAHGAVESYLYKAVRRVHDGRMVNFHGGGRTDTRPRRPVPSCADRVPDLQAARMRTVILRTYGT